MKFLKEQGSLTRQEQLGLEQHSKNMGYLVMASGAGLEALSFGIALSRGSYVEAAVVFVWAAGSNIALLGYIEATKSRILKLRHQLGLEPNTLYRPQVLQPKTQPEAPKTENKELQDSLDDWEDGGDQEVVGDSNNW